VEHGLEPDFPAEAVTETNSIQGPAKTNGNGVRDLKSLVWCSIDNDDSRDLDQLTVAAPGKNGATLLRVAVADVSALVEPGSAVDAHAGANTTSIYTPPRIFPMLPEKLSTDLTSLNEGEDRLAVVIEFSVGEDGAITDPSVYAAAVHNKAKLAYNSVGDWIEGKGPQPEGIDGVPGLSENLKIQDRVAQSLRARRHEQGALELETIDVRAHFEDETVAGLTPERRNRAKEIIENLMIAANGTMARFLTERNFPVMRRVVRSPERWQRIVEIARESEETLPAEPDARALNEFLVRRRAADPARFPDLSLAVIKLLGRGEYVASFPGQGVTGHFGLAVTEYTHSTAPNRRYPDLITQRLLKAALSGAATPYQSDQLKALATHCTKKEDDAQKVERLLRKATAACLLSGRIGEEFDGIVTGASAKGTWTRIFDPPVEGRVEQGGTGLDVGDRVRVKLLHTDPARGFIDFARIGPGPRGSAPQR
ncbi:MAG TPA: RNB domain-containing ribonuclease, partial [Candidatus Limnocylindrales bacterium]|nr:RNB domain-containing ribonuclease [Candidatus Limnocylindrales bacterium]